MARFHRFPMTHREPRAAARDCGNDGNGIWVMEVQPGIVCWDQNHFMYAALGMTGLMAYVPLAALTMVEDYDDKIDVRFIPLYHRIEVLTKGVMAFTVSFTNTKSPMYSFPMLGLIALWMVRYLQSSCHSVARPSTFGKRFNMGWRERASAK